MEFLTFKPIITVLEVHHADTPLRLQLAYQQFDVFDGEAKSAWTIKTVLTNTKYIYLGCLAEGRVKIAFSEVDQNPFRLEDNDND